MNNQLKSLSDAMLISKTQALVAEERRIGVEVLDYLQEIYSRRLYSARGFKSLHEFCVKSLGMSEGSAYRRIATLRLSRDLPETQNAIAEGRVSFTTASLLHGFIQAEEKEKTVSYETKEELFKSIEGKSRVECEKLFATLSPRRVEPDRVRPVSATCAELKLVLQDALLQKLEKIKGLLAHQMNGNTYADLLEKMAEIVLDRIDPERKPAKLKVAPEIPSPARESRYVPAAIKRAIWKRAHGQCEFCDPLTKRRCEGKSHLQLDHIQPFAFGGASSEGNLRLFCAAHNRWAAIQKFGTKKMDGFLKKTN